MSQFESFASSQSVASFSLGPGNGPLATAQVTPRVTGAGLCIAALLSGASGRIPPWALEFMPLTIKGIWTGLGADLGATQLAAEIARGCCFFAASRAGANNRHRARVLSGKYASRLKPKAWTDFHTVLRTCAQSGNWKDMKNGLKFACGRKKKDSGYKLKPSKRTYENSRL